jgi:flagellar biosynthesis protein FliR
MLLVLALRGGAAVALLLTLVGGVPRIVQAGLAVAVGLWSAAVAGGLVPAPGPALDAALWLIAARELVMGATIGVVAAVPLLAVATAGRLVATASGLPGDARARGPYGALFAVLAAAVFVGIDGHVAVVEAIARSFREVPAVTTVEPRVIAALGGLLPAAVRLAVPWLITAAVVEIAAGVAMRVAGRAAIHTPLAAATPAALVMITASLIGTLAVAIAALVRAAL